MSRIDPRIVSTLVLTVSLSACVTPPLAPTIPVAPGPNKSFDVFAADQAACQQYATAQTAPQAYAATNQNVGATLLTTALGAGIGGAVGGGYAAGIGAASGAALGVFAGAGNAGFAQMSIQQQYDFLYGQCMYAHGDQVPGFSPPRSTPPYPGGPGPAPYGGQLYPGAPVPPPSR